MVVFFFPGGSAGPGVPAVCDLCSFPVCFVLYLFLLSSDHFFNELKSMRENADQVADLHNRRASTFLPINPLKMAKTNNTRFGRIENALGQI